MPVSVATMKARNKSVAMTMFSILSEKMHRGLTGHSGPRNAGFSREAISLVRVATFLLLHDRLEVADGNSPARRRVLGAPRPCNKSTSARLQTVGAGGRADLARRRCVDHELYAIYAGVRFSTKP